MTKKPTNIFKMYWNAYGGFHAFWASIYFLIPLLTTLLCYTHWLNNKDWMNDPLTILPSLLGFTLAGYSMWLSVGNEKLKTLLSSKFNKQKNEYSFFMQINASFIHFIIFQLIALIFIYFLKYNSLHLILDKLKNKYNFSNEIILIFDIFSNLIYGLGFFLFIYSIFTMLATVLGIFRISFWIDNQNRKISDLERSINCPECYGDVNLKAKKCMHCGCEFNSIDSSSKPS